MNYLELIAKKLVMNKLEKLELIRDLCSRHSVTAYEIGKHTKISNFAAHKILTGSTQNPNEVTVDIILDFLRERIPEAFDSTDNSSGETKRISGKSIEDIIADKVVAQMEPYLLNIERALVQVLIDTEELKKHAKDQDA